ncbi:MAG: peptidylprolyl isomerase [Phycisphaerae bacterium]
MFPRYGYSVFSGRQRRMAAAAFFVLATTLLSAARADDDGGAVAIVNGHPISRVKMMEVLIDARGVEVLQQLIILQLAKQETKQRGLRVTRADVDAEFQTALTRIAKNAGMIGEYATEKNKRAALQEVLDERGISMAELMVGMERNAHLRKIVAKDLRITEQTLREEFARTYGEKVKASHIQIDQRDARGLNEALDLLGRGAEFAAVARRLSKNPETAARGGEMEPFTFDDPEIPPALREIAFSLKPGEVSSPVLAGQYFHILKLECRIPTDNVRFEDKRAEVEQNLRERAIPQAMAKLAMQLFKQAKIRVVDSKLRPKYQEFLRRGALDTEQP